MSNTRTSVLVPLAQKSKVGVSSTGIMNPGSNTALSSTPSPLATPMSTQSIDSLKSMQMSSLSPAPSPPRISSNLVGIGTLPIVSVNATTPSPVAVRANQNVKSSLASLSKLPPSPRLSGTTSTSSVSSMPSSVVLPPIAPLSLTPLPLASTPKANKSNADVQKSLSNLQSMPPSPRLESRATVAPAPLYTSLPAIPGSSVTMSSRPLAPLSTMSATPVSAAPVTMSAAPVSAAPVTMSATPVSSILSASLAPGLSLPAVGGSVPPSPTVAKASVDIQKSLSNLQVMPPSPRLSSSLPLSGSPSVQRLPGFSGVSSEKPVSFPPEPTLSGKSVDTLVPFDMDREELMEKPVEAILLESGYVPTDKVITKDDRGLLVCQYLKAVDRSGRTVFVDMDCEGFVSVEPSNMTMVKASDASVVPYSIKMGAYDCAASDVCGVAFECDGEVCTLKRSDKDLTPTETVFASARKDGSVYGMMPDYPIPYPIVTLSDIKAKPQEVSSSIRESHDRMRKIAFGHVERDIDNLDKATASLVHEVRKFEEYQKNVSDKLSTTMKEFEAMNDRFIRKPATNDNARALQRTVQYNLRKRNDMVLDYLMYSEAVNSRVSRIKQLASEIKELNELAEQIFSGVGNVYQE